MDDDSLLLSVSGEGEEPDPFPAAPACGTDLMARGMSWLTGQLQSHASNPVVYQRGAARAGVCATFGRKLLKLDDGEGGVRMEWTDRDFLIPAASLRRAGLALPLRGDIVKVREDGATLVYQVMAPGGEPEWQWSDPYRQMLRIHAKFVETQV